MYKNNPMQKQQETTPIPPKNNLYGLLNKLPAKKASVNLIVNEK
jgi:hypothetical protein